jgi:Xaa-Pro aminopeptidase
MLTLEGCRARQQRFNQRLEAAGISAAVISEPRDVYYLTGLLPELKTYPYPNLLFLGPGQKSWLVTGAPTGEALVDERLPYPINTLFTFNPDNHSRAAQLVRSRSDASRGLPMLGYQQEALPHSLALALEAGAAPGGWTPIDEILLDLQLRKDADEIECLSKAVKATLAGYTRAQQLIAPGVSELEILTESQKAAQLYTGEVHFFGGDFRSGQFGGPARPRAIEEGELYIIDAWSDVDGYWCDMSRTWSVGGAPTELQQSVFDHIAGILSAVPQMAKPGGDTSAFWRELDNRVREHPYLGDLGMKDHGGHGIGLRVHEMPDLNRDRGGVFEVGNVFTCEPAAYTPELNAGVRLENVFVITQNGTEVLVDYPLGLIADPNCGTP